MVFKIGNLDIVPYIAYQGLKWSRNDIDAQNSGRALDGTMYRDRVTTKARWDVTLRPVTSAELSKILTAIQPEYVTVTATDPISNKSTTKTYYSNNIPAQYLMIKNGIEYWQGVTFPLIER